MAGVLLAAYLLPASIGDASLAGLPPEAGMYACLFSGLVFWIFCSSKHTMITVSSAISLLIGSTIGGLAGGDITRYVALASVTALMISVISFAAWLMKAGGIVRFISEGVLAGFKCGVSLFLASTQLPKLFGFASGHGDFWENCSHFLNHLRETNSTALTVGSAALAILVLSKLFLPNKPTALFVVAGGILLAAVAGLESRGVTLLGEIPSGVPSLKVPLFHRSELNELLPLAIACFLLAAVETAAIGRMFAAKHDTRFDANQELLALAVANLASGMGRGFPVSGGMSQSIVNEEGGARTPLSGLVAAGIVFLGILFLSRWLRFLPQPVLAAVVLVAISGLFQLSALRHFWRNDRLEFAVAMTAFLSVLGAGLLRGVLIGSVISLVLLLRRASHPHVALLGRIPGTKRFSDFERHPDNELIPGVLVFRPEASLLYFNVDHVCEVILNHTYRQETQPRLIVLDLSASAYVDLQAAHTLLDLAHKLKASGIEVQTVEAHAAVRDRLRTEGVDVELGELDRRRTLADVVWSITRVESGEEHLSEGE